MTAEDRRAPDGWSRGRYVHAAGTPRDTGEALAAIVARDGVRAALRTLTVEHFGWSVVDAGQPDISGVAPWVGRWAEAGPGSFGSPELVAAQFDPASDHYCWDARHENVPGYGVAWTDAVVGGRRQIRRGDWVRAGSGDLWGAEWVYVVGVGGLTVQRADWRSGAVETVETVPWAAAAKRTRDEWQSACAALGAEKGAA